MNKTLIFPKFFFAQLLFFSFVFCLINKAYGKSSESFEINFYNTKAIVISPTNTEQETSLVVYNKTLKKIWGKLVDENNEVIKYINIDVEQFKTVDLNFKDYHSLSFVSITPPFQKIELKFKVKQYEIP